MGYTHNVLVMPDLNPPLSKWLRSRAQNLDRATIGQLLTLMNLVGAESVAEVGRKLNRANSLSDTGVNSRQKLARLEEALGIGKLTTRVGKCTQPTSAGIRVAGETRLFLQELCAIETSKAPVPTWIIGAGDAWLQSVIIPALAKIAKSRPDSRWEIRNLRAADIRSGLRDGLLHFGFFREAELGTGGEFTVGTRIQLESYRIIAGNCANSHKSAKHLVRWLLDNKRPLAQQGSSWTAIRGQLTQVVGMETELSQLSPQIACETHSQAITAVEAGNSWCVVPSGLGRILPPHCRSMVVKVTPAPDIINLVHYPRALKKHAGYDTAARELADAIRDVARAM
jgi:DNA-binding transcriptional LysR family regulator